MEDMRELITVQAFERGLLVAALAWVGLCILAGIVGRARGRPRALSKGVAWALVGVLVWALWVLWAWMVRVEPETGYVGLHRVWVFVLCLAVFAAVGALVGIGLARLYRRTEGGDAAASSAFECPASGANTEGGHDNGRKDVL